MRLQKTTIVIWSDPDYTNPHKIELSDLAREAETGLAHCSKSDTVTVEDPIADPDWDGTDFFDVEEDADVE